jgi:aminoglycoside 6'-N-acetyltransferase I
MEISYRIASVDDLNAITELSILMCSGDYCGEHSDDELLISNREDLLNPKMAMFLAFDGDKAVGFSHVYMRHEWVIGTENSPVGYLEGIFVCPSYRGQGIAQTLVRMCENWSREKGCVEFASDCDLDNTDSLAFHLKIGFKETGRIIFFSKEL